MNLNNNKTLATIHVCAAINLIVIVFLHFDNSSYFDLSLVVFSFLLFILMEISSKSENAEFARNWASRYTLTTFFATLLSFSLIGHISKNIEIDFSVIIYVNAFHLLLYQLLFIYMLKRRKNGMDLLLTSKYIYFYWIISIIILAFIILAFVK